VTIENFSWWLSNYKIAWERHDPELIATLFSEDAIYKISPFAEDLQDRDAIVQYWCDISSHQGNVQFAFDILHVDEDGVGMAHWTAQFNRVKSEKLVYLDGIMRCQFDHVGQCELFEEWWHSHSIAKDDEL